MSKRTHAAALSSSNADAEHAPDTLSPKRQRGHDHAPNGSATAAVLPLGVEQGHSHERDQEPVGQECVALGAPFDSHQLEQQNQEQQQPQQQQQQQHHERNEQTCASSTFVPQDPSRSVTFDEASKQFELTSTSTRANASQQLHASRPDVANNSAVAVAATPMVIAPLFTPVHSSWDAFEQSLKEYAQATYQLYVIRTTTSVKRRNQRIMDNATAASAALSSSQTPRYGPGSVVRESNSNDDVADSETLAVASSSSSGDGIGSGGAVLDAEPDHQPAASPPTTTVAADTNAQQQLEQQQLIPESYQWYSKTLMCTHGWKDRHRGSGKRSLSVARSTGCPAKMCVTLQHRKGDDGWNVVLTRHVRTHNHQLSKELFLYYMDNRRIYDPELLVVGATSALTQASASHTATALTKTGLSHLLANPGAQHAGLLSGSPTAVGTSNTSHTNEHANSVRDSSAQDESAGLATSVDRVLDASQSQHSHGLKKTHASWDAFHTYLLAYAAQSGQSFRTRSTVSVAAKNAKTLSLARKTGRTEADVARQLVPAHERWYYKMLICSHGWRRKSRSKAVRPAHADDSESNAGSTCPAMLMARMQRDVHDNWRVVISRYMPEHNHAIVCAPDAVRAASSSASTNSVSSTSINAAPVPTDSDSQRVVPFVAMTAAPSAAGHDASALHPTAFQYIDVASTSGTSNALHDAAAEHNAAASLSAGVSHSSAQQQPLAQAPGDVVVRAPKFQDVHVSWDAFHASLQEYSDATFQLYRTRTASSVQGRNQKILAVKHSHVNSANGVSSSSNKPSDARLIPGAWKWYSKTLTCTHGWKERRRGTGKRKVQICRSTACPVKICATVQFVDDAERVDGGDWRVVVTKHIVGHNHNLSKELQQHYCENRRIYDPELFKIDVVRGDAAMMLEPTKLSLHRPLGVGIGGTDNHVLMPTGDASLYASGEHSSGSASGRTESDALSRPMQQQQQQQQQQHQYATSMFQSFALTSDTTESLGLSAAAAHAGITSAHDSSSDAAMLSATGTTATGSHAGLPAPMLAYSGPFLPHTAPNGNSHNMFVTGSHPQQFAFQPHHYFALEQAVTMGFATTVHYPPPPASLVATSTNSSNNIAAGAYTVTSNALQTLCRVHSSPGTQHARLHSDSMSSLCTCFRSATVASAPSVRPRAQMGSAERQPPSPPSSATELPDMQQQQQQQQRAFNRHATDTVEHDALDGADNDESAGDSGSGGPNSSAVWQSTLAPEIVTLTSADGTTLWRAPRIQRLHSSWDALQTHLEAYSLATFQLFRVRTTSSASARNVRIVRQTADRRESETASVPTHTGPDAAALPTLPATAASLLVPESYQWYSKTFVCTHGWKERRRGTGQRVSHNLRATACPAKLCVTLQRVVHAGNAWHVVVTRQDTDHNHELSRSAYQQYSEVRRIKDTTLLERAEALWQHGLSRRKVFEFLKDHAPNAIVMKDVHNLVQRWQQAHGKVAVASRSGDSSSSGDSVDRRAGDSEDHGERDDDSTDVNRPLASAGAAEVSNDGVVRVVV